MAADPQLTRQASETGRIAPTRNEVHEMRGQSDIPVRHHDRSGPFRSPKLLLPGSERRVGQRNSKPNYSRRFGFGSVSFHATYDFSLDHSYVKSVSPFPHLIQLFHILRLSQNLLVFGYAYPAYDCFKTVEKNKPEIEQLLFWCQYWIIVAMLTVFERVGDAFISWLPLYSEVKLAIFIYLWHPKTKGTSYLYNSFFQPYVAKHEGEIDHTLLELRVKAWDIAILYWQKSVNFGQTRFFEILQYVSSQSAARPKPDKVSIDKEK